MDGTLCDTYQTYTCFQSLGVVVFSTFLLPVLWEPANQIALYPIPDSKPSNGWTHLLEEAGLICPLIAARGRSLWIADGARLEELLNKANSRSSSAETTSTHLHSTSTGYGVQIGQIFFQHKCSYGLLILLRRKARVFLNLKVQVSLLLFDQAVDILIILPTLAGFPAGTKATLTIADLLTNATMCFGGEI